MRGTDVVRCALGAGLLVAPEAGARLTRTPLTPGVRLTVRVLAARYLVQSLLGDRLAPRWHTDLDVALDGAHAATMVALAAASPTHRRLALLSGTVAAVLAAADASVGSGR